MEAAYKTALAKGEAGLFDRDTVPTLAEFKGRFLDAIAVRCAEHPSTISFYREKFQRLLDFAPLANARLDEIDEELIEAFVQARRRTVGPATTNRALATLRRCLRLAQRWRVLDRLPQINLLAGEKQREFVLAHGQAEDRYLAACPDPLRDVALLMLDTGMRPGEALALRWSDIHLDPPRGSKFGYLAIRNGKSRYAKRNLSLTGRVTAMLQSRQASSESPLLFPGAQGEKSTTISSLDHQHEDVRQALALPAEFVVYSLRHTMLTRLGEAGAGAFTIQRIAGHSSVTVSQRYVHPSPESQERAFERLEALNASRATTVFTTPT